MNDKSISHRSTIIKGVAVAIVAIPLAAAFSFAALMYRSEPADDLSGTIQNHSTEELRPQH